jgi:hypothetical protein
VIPETTEVIPETTEVIPETTKLTVSTGRSASIPVRKVLYGNSDVESNCLILLLNSRLTMLIGCLSYVFIVHMEAGYTMFRGSVKGTGYPLHSPVSPSLPHPCVTACHHISTAVYLLTDYKRTSPFKSAGGGVSSADCWQPRCAHQR